MKEKRQIKNKKKKIQREDQDSQEFELEEGATTVVDSASPRENWKQEELMCSGMWEYQQEKKQDARGQSPPQVIRSEVEQKAKKMRFIYHSRQQVQLCETASQAELGPHKLDSSEFESLFRNGMHRHATSVVTETTYGRVMMQTHQPQPESSFQGQKLSLANIYAMKALVGNYKKKLKKSKKETFQSHASSSNGDNAKQKINHLVSENSNQALPSMRNQRLDLSIESQEDKLLALGALQYQKKRRHQLVCSLNSIQSLTLPDHLTNAPIDVIDSVDKKKRNGATSKIAKAPAILKDSLAIAGGSFTPGCGPYNWPSNPNFQHRVQKNPFNTRSCAGSSVNVSPNPSLPQILLNQTVIGTKWSPSSSQKSLEAITTLPGNSKKHKLSDNLRNTVFNENQNQLVGIINLNLPRKQLAKKALKNFMPHQSSPGWRQ